MEFQRLRLVGFKSFAEAVDIALLPGLTGIVGPNGCGKSNLTEALRWAMGEGRAGGLRADAMDEVIFAGARGRPGRNIAEVMIGLLGKDGEQIEVTRRIARGEGSAYRLNGADARQRDVQLLFADAATGAHAAALVGQGRVAAVIAAKPTERRAMLEEAAGIAGLAVRRKEAEARLRAASANLARVEDLGRELDAQVASLKRQARAAERYADLSARIRAGEARLLFAGWRAADARAGAAAAGARTAEAAVEAARAQIADAEAARAAAGDGAYRARDAEGAARAGAERLERAAAALADEQARAGRRRRELDTAAGALARDAAREEAAVAEARAALARAEGTLGRLAAGEAARADEAEAARAAAALAAQSLPIAEAALADAMDARARAVAERRAADEAVRAGLALLARRATEIAALEREATNLAPVAGTASGGGASAAAAMPGDAAATHDAAVVQLAREAEAARAAGLAASDDAAAARARLDTARATLDDARGRLDAAQARVAGHSAALATARAVVAALTAEAAALRPAAGSGNGGPVLGVTPGWETALAAALGDELEGHVGVAGDGWARLVAGAGDAPLPPGCVVLVDHVRAPPELARRLRQVGVVADSATGAALAAGLAPGQRLVSRAGALWRWDGYERARAGVGGGAAAARLRAANRAVALEGEIGSARDALAAIEAAAAADAAARDTVAGEVRAADAERAAAAAALSGAEARRTTAERACGELESRAARARAEGEARRARVHAEAEAAAARVREAEARRATRLATVEAGLARLAQERALALAEADAADARLAGAADPARADAALVAARAAAEAARAARERAGVRVAAASRAIEEAARATAAARDDAAQWARRGEEAAARLAELTPRIEEIALEQAELPAAGGEDTAETAARTAHCAATESARLATAARAREEAALADVEAALAAANEARAAQREARAAAQVEADHAGRAREELRRAALDRHGCEPSLLPGRFGFEGDDAPVARREAELEQLVRDRERLGAVNLRALVELDDSGVRAATLGAERQEVETAIARLRGSIGALNRDGRTRLLATFDGVDRRFRLLFATLFEGGEARLALIDSEDPLDAGLEIYAKPPGKAAQSLALLSGGEQALTAVALLFAFFLENPSPICVLDEVDAPLDDANVERFCDLLREVAGGTRTRFLVVTHNPVTMASMDRLYGVTMAEPGVSQLVSVDLAAAEALLAAA